MKNKKNLLSVLLTAVLLCALVCGVLVFGTGAEGTKTVYVVTGTSQAKVSSTYVVDEAAGTEEGTGNLTFETVIDAITYAADQTWGAEDTLEIQINVPTYTVEQRTNNNLIFSTKGDSIWRGEDESLLPVTLKPHASQTEGVTIEWGYCGNLYSGADLTIEGMTLDFTPATLVPSIYVGGTLELKDVTINAESKTTTTGEGEDATTSPCMYANGFTKGVYPFKSKAQFDALADEGKYTSSITFSGTTTVPECFILAAVSAPNTNAEDNGVVAELEYDDGTVARTSLGGKLVIKDQAVINRAAKGGMNAAKTSVFGHASVEVLGGTVNGYIQGQGATTNTTYPVDIEVLVNGGTVNGSVWGNGGYTQGTNVTVNVKYLSGTVTGNVMGATSGSTVYGTVNTTAAASPGGSIFGIDKAKVYGTANLYITGGEHHITSSKQVRMNGQTSASNYTVYAGGELAMYLQGGTIYSNQTNFSAFYGPGASTAGFQDGSIMRLVLDGGNIDIDPGTGTMYDRIIYGGNGNNATLNCDIYVEIRDYTPPSDQTDRLLYDINLTGDYYLTIDTTDDGWKQGTENDFTSLAEDDSNANTKGREVVIGGTLQEEWSCTFQGNKYTRINGGNDASSVSLATYFTAPGVNVDQHMRNCTFTKEYGFNRNSSTTGGVQNVTNNFYGAKFNGTYFYAAGRYNAATTIAGKVENTFENCIATKKVVAAGGRNSSVGTIVNNFKGGNTFTTFCASMFAAKSYSATVGDVINNFSGTNTFDTFSVTDSTEGAVAVDNITNYITGELILLTDFYDAGTADALTVNESLSTYFGQYYDAESESVVDEPCPDSDDYGVHVVGNTAKGAETRKSLYLAKGTIGAGCVVKSVFKNVAIGSYVYIYAGDASFEGKSRMATPTGTCYSTLSMNDGTTLEIGADCQDFKFGVGRLSGATDGADITINGGYHYGYSETYGAKGIHGKTVNITGGRFEQAVKATEKITISGGRFGVSASAVAVEAPEVTISGGEFNWASTVNGEKVTLAGGTVYVTGGATQINATDITSATHIIRVGQNVPVSIRDGHVYVSLPDTADSNLLTFDDAGVTGYWMKEVEGDKLVIKGHRIETYEASLVITNRVAIKFYMNKVQVDHALANSPKALTYKFTTPYGDVEGELSDLSELNKEGDAYVVSLDAVGAKDFDSNFKLEGAIFEEKEFSINSIATAGAAVEGASAELVTLYKALLDYGAAAEGTLTEQTAGVEIDTTDIPADLSAEKGNGKVVFDGKNLLMGDAIGIRLYIDAANSADTNATVKLFGEDITSKCVIDTTEKYTVDIYINALRMNDKLVFTVYDNEGTLCLTLTDTVKNIANQLATAEPENLKALSTLALIQAIQNYAATLA